MQTRLLYLEDMCTLTCEAHVIKVVQEGEENKVILDQTVFYPQGGGQPSDKGTIKNAQALFDVQGVSIEDGVVYHKGAFQDGSFAQDADVTVQVDPALRALHNRNHTVGHLINYALYNLGYSLVSGKA